MLFNEIPMLLLKTLLHTILLPCTIVVWLPLYLLSSTGELRRPTWDALSILGLIPAAFAFAIFVWCTYDFIKHGRGTPNPLDPPKIVVARGPYRWVRNPMYVAVMFILAGEALVFRSTTLLVYSVCVLLGFHLFVVIYEEPTLSRSFGESYENYRREVPRWLPLQRVRK